VIVFTILGSTAIEVGGEHGSQWWVQAAPAGGLGLQAFQRLYVRLLPIQCLSHSSSMI